MQQFTNRSVPDGQTRVSRGTTTAQRWRRALLPYCRESTLVTVIVMTQMSFLDLTL